MILSLFVASAGLRAGFEAWKCNSRGRRRESRLRGVREVTFRGRRSTLCALDVWMGKDSWQAQGIVRLLVVVEVNVAVPLRLACERMLFGGARIAKLLGRAT